MRSFKQKPTDAREERKQTVDLNRFLKPPKKIDLKLVEELINISRQRPHPEAKMKSSEFSNWNDLMVKQEGGEDYKPSMKVICT